MTPLLLLAALGCNEDPVPVTESGKDSQVVDTNTRDTGGDSGPAGADSQDTDPGSGLDSAEPEPDPGVLDVAPRELVVDPGATWTLRAVHQLEGAYSDVAPEWESSDPAVVSLSDQGVATAVAPGVASLTAWYGGLEAVAAVTVQENPLLRIQLVEAETGLPLAAATVTHDGETVPVDPVTGVAELTIPPGEPVTVTALSDDDSRIPTTRSPDGTSQMASSGGSPWMAPRTFSRSSNWTKSEGGLPAEKRAWTGLGGAGGCFRLGGGPSGIEPTLRVPSDLIR